ncbi:MAG: arginine--tRNA ligase [Lachnospiraceae bacterium]|nr:arginine--tRNA ligase [Lachnospiraceae bacterium]
MNNILEQITDIVSKGFEAAGYDGSYGKVGISNRPDLCEFQCNGAMALAKQYHKAPIAIAQDIAAKLLDDNAFSTVDAVAPGFLNIKLSDDFLSKYLNGMESEDKFGVPMPESKKIIVDYGGPNVAKPLHVGHLRAAIIGESVKRICRYLGNDVIGDVHLGDWGLQMGLIITELRTRKPDLPYFDEGFTGEYPTEPPFTLSELEEIYPCASAKSKDDEQYKEAALTATRKLQSGDRGYRAIWKHIMDVSIPDLKRNYENLSVEFDWWKGESSVDDLIPGMVEDMKKQGFAYESEGALVVDVAQESDTKEIPPCMILKSDGAALYTTTDLATLRDRRSEFDPDQVIYVVDKRQEMHFIQVFRCAKKTGIVKPDTKLDFLGFGTMNGKDGKPFKTREGGVMRLETLISDIREAMYNKIIENHETDPEEARATSNIVALAAIKYGDLSNQATKDYVFDTDKFISFEGNTGPYILYTMVRIKSILSKYGNDIPKHIGFAQNELERALMLQLTGFSQVVLSAYEEIAPHKICSYIYDVCNAFNRFYHETRILAEEDKARQEGWIALLSLTLRVLETCIDLLGFSAPEKM